MCAQRVLNAGASKEALFNRFEAQNRRCGCGCGRVMWCVYVGVVTAGTLPTPNILVEVAFFV